jgi:hypothetical protein
MIKHIAKGTFTVEMTPQGGAADTPAGMAPLGRLLLSKVFSGDIAGSSSGEMLTAVTATPGSAGYVALERVVGTVHGRSGSFVMQHSGLMSQAGGQQLTIVIVPGSGSGELAGIDGHFTLKIDAGLHHYELAYTLPA